MLGPSRTLALCVVVSLLVLSFNTSSAGIEGNTDFGLLGQGEEPTKKKLMHLDMKYEGFLQNKGQWDDQVLFSAKCPFGRTFLCDDGAYYDIYGEEEGYMIRTTFLTQTPPSIKGKFETEYICNIIRGREPKDWITGTKSYREVHYEDLWPGIDMYFHRSGADLKYDLVLEPGSDPSDIVIAVEGHDRLTVESNRVIIKLPRNGKLFDSGIVATYENGDPVDAKYVKISEDSYGFELIRDPARTVVIDPIIYSTFLGGSYGDQLVEIEVDEDYDIYMAGTTASIDFPNTTGAYNKNVTGRSDLFVSKLSNNGTGLIFSTYIGGTNFDNAIAMDIDEEGNIYFTGNTNSIDFPTTPGVLQEHNHNSMYQDIFLLKLNSSGASLDYSTYIMGDWYELVRDLVVDDGYAHLVGYHESHDFPSVEGPVGGVHGTAFYLMIDRLGQVVVGIFRQSFLY